MDKAELWPLLLALAGMALLLRASWTDLVSRRIDNANTAALGMLWFFYAAFDPASPPVLMPLGLAVATLLVGAFAWSRGWLGGGDAKLLAVLMLWAGPHHALSLLLTTALAGGALAITVLWYDRVGFILYSPFAAMVDRACGGLAGRRRSVGDGARRRSLPYALALAAGGFVVGAKLFMG